MPATTNALSSLESLTVLNARTALEQGVAAIRAGQQQFDFASLKTVDSAAVSVLLAWQRAALAAGTQVRYTNLPASLNSLATLYGVDAFLSTSGDGASTPAELHHH